ncbi:Protease-associated domain-containing protein 1 [Chionoecetes opilio]|uniref:Protease-associated domain-containing protein 1 n=1 Tax=Chionoecetes opilio TaxID=41210 RepID=A0A8J4XVE5_CHIOP|nr:Protease-associated domain-containing protein 1 [Chionoecetes opilio]
MTSSLRSSPQGAGLHLPPQTSQELWCPICKCRGRLKAMRERIFTGIRLVLADPLDSCSPPYNALELQGAVVLVARGGCSFVSKAVKAEAAGALAVIVMDNNKDNDEQYVEMVEDNTHRNPNIPAAFLLGRSG